MASLTHCFIYAMRGLDSGLVKIGRSWNPRARLRFIAREVEPVELLASVPAPEQMEYELHRRFEAERVDVRGREWFRNEGDVAAWLADLPAEHRATGSHRVRRRAPHLTPEQADSMRRYLRTHGGMRGAQRADEFYRQHGHGFVPGEYPEGCRACAALSVALDAPPTNLLIALDALRTPAARAA